MAGLLRIMEQRPAQQALGLDDHSRVLLFSTEGATDPVSYLQQVGRTSEQVLEAGAAVE